MRNLFYFLVGFCLAALLLPALSFGDDLQWDACTDATGYNVYYTSDDTNYIHYDNGNQTICEDIDNTLNLPYGVEVTFHVMSYNLAGEAGPSNTVTYTRTAYVPPENNLPPIVINVPGPVTITINQ